MAVQTAQFKVELKVGPHRLIMVRFASVSNGDTWASGLNSIGSTPFFSATVTGTPSGAGNCGVNPVYSAGTVTFNMGTDAKQVDLLCII